MKSRYIFFRGLLDTLSLYTDEFVRLYTGTGAECLVLDAARMEEEMQRLKAFLLSEVTAVISFNNIGLHLELEEDVNVWDQFQVPFYNILMDHPFHYKYALDRAPEQMILFCMDENHVQYVRRFFPHIRQVKFFPHAGIERNADMPKAKRKGAPKQKIQNPRVKLQERKIEVLYAGGLSRYAAEGLIPDLGQIREFDAFTFVQDALAQLIRQPELTTEYVIERCLQDRGIGYDDKWLGELITRLRFLDSFAVSYFREQIVRGFTEHGIPVTVFGSGWDRCEWDNPNLLYGGEVPPGQILELMGQSKIVLNTMTWFKRGAHDRVFNGMLAGAAVVSDTSSYLKDCFEDSRDILLFSLRDINSLIEKVKILLRDVETLQSIADCGYETAKKQHLWADRLQGAGIL